MKQASSKFHYVNLEKVLIWKLKAMEEIVAD